MEVPPSSFPDWAHHLPLLPLYLISKKMKSITDFLRFRAVCSPWRSASVLEPRLPWLMIPYDPFSTYKKDEGARLFYDLWESKMRVLHLPETIGMSCLASSRGWLLVVGTDGTEVFLLNPLTRARNPLPSFSFLCKHQGGYWNYFAIRKLTFSADLTDPNCLITVFLGVCWWVFCCRVGDSCWASINSHWNSFGEYTDATLSSWGASIDRILKSIGEFTDGTYYNGRFYLLSEGAITIIGSNKPEERTAYSLEPKLCAVRKYFLEGKSGVYVIFVDPDQRIELYQFQEPSMKLKQITSTCNTAIFHGDNDHYLAVCSDDWDSLDGNLLYMCKSVA